MASESESPQPIDACDRHARESQRLQPDRTPDIVTRLRQTRADMIGTDDEDHYFDCHEAAGEIERLRLWGRLTDAEREALEVAVEYVGSAYAVEHHARTLRGLLERTK